MSPTVPGSARNRLLSGGGSPTPRSSQAGRGPSAPPILRAARPADRKLPLMPIRYIIELPAVAG